MKTTILLPLILLSLFCQPLFAQTGPGGIGTTDGNSNLKLWLQSSDLKDFLDEDEQVLEWRDNSGAANNLLALTPSQAPIFQSGYGEDQVAVVFNGNNYLQTDGPKSSFNNPESTIFLVKAGKYSGTPIAIASNGWANEMLLFNYSQYHHSSSGNFEQLQHPCLQQIPNDELAIICGVFGQQPTDLRFIVNSYESALPLFSPGNSSAYSAIDRKVTLGQRDQFVQNEFFNGALLEVIVYNTKLSEAEILQVEDYLQCKYRIKPGGSCSELTEDACQFNFPVINDEIQELMVSLSPIPTVDYIQLTMNRDIPLEGMDYVIYDQLGRTFAQQKIISLFDLTIDVRQYPIGAYYLKLTVQDKIITKPFIVH